MIITLMSFPVQKTQTNDIFYMLTNVKTFFWPWFWCKPFGHDKIRQDLGGFLNSTGGPKS